MRQPPMAEKWPPGRVRGEVGFAYIMQGPALSGAKMQLRGEEEVEQLLSPPHWFPPSQNQGAHLTTIAGSPWIQWFCREKGGAVARSPYSIGSS